MNSVKLESHGSMACSKTCVIQVGDGQEIILALKQISV